MSINNKTKYCIYLMFEFYMSEINCQLQCKVSRRNRQCDKVQRFNLIITWWRGEVMCHIVTYSGRTSTICRLNFFNFFHLEFSSWCSVVTSGYPGAGEWRSGLGLCAILARFRPDLVNYDTLGEVIIMNDCN